MIELLGLGIHAQREPARIAQALERRAPALARAEPVGHQRVPVVQLGPVAAEVDFQQRVGQPLAGQLAQLQRVFQPVALVGRAPLARVQAAHLRKGAGALHARRAHLHLLGVARGEVTRDRQHVVKGLSAHAPAVLVQHRVRDEQLAVQLDGARGLLGRERLYVGLAPGKVVHRLAVAPEEPALAQPAQRLRVGRAQQRVAHLKVVGQHHAAIGSQLKLGQGERALRKTQLQLHALFAHAEPALMVVHEHEARARARVVAHAYARRRAVGGRFGALVGQRAYRRSQQPAEFVQEHVQPAREEVALRGLARFAQRRAEVVAHYGQVVGIARFARLLQGGRVALRVDAAVVHVVAD